MRLCSKCKYLRTVDVRGVGISKKWISVDYCRMIDAYLSEKLIDALKNFKNVNYPEECDKFKEIKR
jgi:hypothetical protein